MSVFSLEQRETRIEDMAKRAKNRMKSGFWTENRRKIELFSKSQEKTFEREEVFHQYLKASKPRQKSPSEIEEDRMYPIVKMIIDEDDGLNPLGRLIDRNQYEMMTHIEKQAYVFELSGKYQKLKARYLLEKEMEARLLR